MDTARITSSPEARARLIFSRDIWLWGVPNCPLCSEKHTHGAEFHWRGTHPRKSLGHRVGHCDSSVSVERQGVGYVLVDGWPEETDKLIVKHAADVERAKVRHAIRERAKAQGVAA